MTINIISDIHADINSKTREIVYNLPFKYSNHTYIECITKLTSFWKANLEKFSKMKFPDCSTFSNTFRISPISNVTDIYGILIDIKKCIDTNFETFTVKNMHSYVSALYIISDFLALNGMTLESLKLNISLHSFINFILKQKSDFDPAKLESADYLIIAGDLGLDNTYDEILNDIENKTKGKFKKILHIAGNHDHWWYGSGKDGACRPDTVNLDRDYCEYYDGDYAFIGCTLWTPISDNSIWMVGRHMNDYKYIPGKFSPYSSRHQFEIQSTWLKNKIQLNKDKKIIVFTHHQPFEELTATDYKHNGKDWDGIDVNAAYVVLDHSLDDINRFKNIKLWCCGHTHQNFDDVIHDVHVVRNPIGYRDHYGYCPAENISETWYNKIIEV